MHSPARHNELRLTEQEEYMPQTGQKERCLCFNYFEDGKLVNTKFRTLQKHFRMVSGAELIPYHIDALRGTPECIFTEGELDAASFMAIGRRDVVSVPSGANSNLQWMDRLWRPIWRTNG
ncbi:MAG: toprim domain-containing protein [Flavonifractor plautii]